MLSSPSWDPWSLQLACQSARGHPWKPCRCTCHTSSPSPQVHQQTCKGHKLHTQDDPPRKRISHLTFNKQMSSDSSPRVSPFLARTKGDPPSQPWSAWNMSMHQRVYQKQTDRWYPSPIIWGAPGRHWSAEHPPNQTRLEPQSPVRPPGDNCQGHSTLLSVTCQRRPTAC